jgi:outer membrane murein-binding lipoprotein Lpp
MKYINLRLLLALSATVVVFTLSGCNNSAEDEFYKQFSAEQVQELKQTKAKITAAKEEQNSIKGRLDTAKDELSMTIQQYTGMRSEIDYYNDLFNNVQMLESKRDSLIQEITSIEPSVYNGAFL